MNLHDATCDCVTQLLIKTVQIPDDYKLVPFDVKSLFTSIPLQLALDGTETYHYHYYRQLRGFTEPLSYFYLFLVQQQALQTVAQNRTEHLTSFRCCCRIIMQNIEEKALATYKQTQPLWLRYVDYASTATHKDKIDDF